MRRRGVETREDDRIMLLTFPRAMGYVFNPVSFFFCFRKTGEAVCAVAEVGNTFREMKRFLLPEPAANRPNFFELTAAKHFYVSPFSDLDVKFNFRLRVPIVLDGKLTFVTPRQFLQIDKVVEDGEDVDPMTLVDTSELKVAKQPK